MRKFSLLSAALLLLSIVAWAAPKDQSYSGWISDSKCGAKGANAAHAACAKKCIDGGEKPVMVADADQKIMPIDNPDAVKDQIGQHVKVNGTMTSSGALHVDKVQSQSQ
jgi:hypothetical protein